MSKITNKLFWFTCGFVVCGASVVKIVKESDILKTAIRTVAMEKL